MNLLHVLNEFSSSETFSGGFAGTWNAAVLGFISSFISSIFIVSTRYWHGAYSMDASEGIQKFHEVPTPRVGGIAVAIGLVVAWFFSSPELQTILGLLILAGIPAFIFGLAEDVTKRVSVVLRLMATMASGLFAWWLTKYSLTRIDIAGLDYILGISFLSVLFTCFAVGGIANSINIIDGFNGLASTASTIAFASLAIIAYQVGDLQVTALSLVLVFCVLGFFCVNWPFGKIFLGDGGAYLIGYFLAWLAVMLIERNIQVSAFAALLVCVHPVTEVLFSIFRRKLKNLHPGHPDRLHFHSIVKQRYIRRWFSNFNSNNRNSITGLIIGAMTLSSGIVANFVYQSTLFSAIAFFAFFLAYVAIYARMVKFRWVSPFSFLLVKPKLSRKNFL